MALNPAPVESTAKFPELVCPVDHLSLGATENRLHCTNGHAFKFDRGIPRILLSETQYADAFGEQWNTYRVTQLDSYTKTTISENRLRRCLGETLWERLRKPE